MGDVTGGDGDERYPNKMFNGTVLHLTWVDAQGGGGAVVTFSCRSLSMNPRRSFQDLSSPSLASC